MGALGTPSAVPDVGVLNQKSMEQLYLLKWHQLNEGGVMTNKEKFLSVSILTVIIIGVFLG